jgi:hypothetical protein
MPYRNQRVTLIAREQSKPDVDWNYARCRAQRVAFLDSVASLKFALGAALTDVGLDIERVIVDRAGSADEFLDLLATMPSEFNGDVLLVRDDGGGFMSAAGRGGDRVMYALSPYDVRFYLETQDMVTGRAALEMTA